LLTQVNNLNIMGGYLIHRLDTHYIIVIYGMLAGFAGDMRVLSLRMDCFSRLVGVFDFKAIL